MAGIARLSRWGGFTDLFILQNSRVTRLVVLGCVRISGLFILDRDGIFEGFVRDMIRAVSVFVVW